MKKKGMALILAMVVIAVLATLSTVMVSRSVSERLAAQRHTESSQAFWLAEAGIQRASWELNHGDGNWTSWSTGASGEKILPPQSLGGIGQYEVTVVGPSSNTPEATATGYVPGKSAWQSERTILVELKKNSPFTYAAFGDISLTMTGNGETDSYDSSLGGYGGLNIGSNGDVGTNGATIGAITLSGNAKVNGDANTGPGGTVSDESKVTGDVSHDCDENLPSAIVPSALTGLASGGSYSISGNTSATLGPGDFKYSSISISANANLTIIGTVRIYLTGTALSLSVSGNGKLIITAGASLILYIDGRCDISGNGVVNQTNLPENFLVYSTYSSTGNGIQITGNGDLYGAVYAPKANVLISGNGDIYGSVVGKTVSIPGNGDVHYDEALKDAGPVSNYSLENWREEINPYPLTK